MFLTTTIIMATLLAISILLARHAYRRARSETPAQRAERIRDEDETAAILSILEDDRR